MLGILLVASVGATPAPPPGQATNWILVGFTLARAIAGVWLIAFGAKGKPSAPHY